MATIMLRVCKHTEAQPSLSIFFQLCCRVLVKHNKGQNTINFLCHVAETNTDHDIQKMCVWLLNEILDRAPSPQHHHIEIASEKIIAFFVGIALSDVHSIGDKQWSIESLGLLGKLLQDNNRTEKVKNVLRDLSVQLPTR